MDDDILRQRRNLIAISTVLILFDFADVKIAKVGVLGTELIVGSPDVLIIFTWTIWAYLLLRYYQYWRRDSRSLFKHTLYDKVGDYASRYSSRRSFKEKHKLDSKADLYIEAPWDMRFSVKKFNPKLGAVEEIFSMKVSLWLVLYWKIKATVHFVVHTPHFTDHSLPFALALSAPIITVLTKCNTG